MSSHATPLRWGSGGSEGGSASYSWGGESWDTPGARAFGGEACAPMRVSVCAHLCTCARMQTSHVRVLSGRRSGIVSQRGQNLWNPTRRPAATHVEWLLHLPLRGGCAEGETGFGVAHLALSPPCSPDLLCDPGPLL